MMKENVNGALRLFSNKQCNDILPLDERAINVLHVKNTYSCPLNDDLPYPIRKPCCFESIDKSVILKVAVKAKDTSGISGLDADEWRRTLGSKICGEASSDLRKTLRNFKVRFKKKLLCFHHV